MEGFGLLGGHEKFASQIGRTGADSFAYKWDRIGFITELRVASARQRSRSGELPRPARSSLIGQTFPSSTIRCGSKEAHERHNAINEPPQGIVLGTNSPASSNFGTLETLEDGDNSKVARSVASPGPAPRHYCASQVIRQTGGCGALGARAKLEAEADRNRWQADTRASETTTLGELLLRYVRHVTPNKRGAAPERARINTIVRCTMAQRTRARLTSAHVALYRDERLKIAAPATVVCELSTISHALEIATCEWGFWLPRNPARGIRRPPLPRGRTRRLQPDEERRLLEFAGRMQFRLLRPLVIVALETAMRRGEILSLNRSCVDLAQRVVHLTHTKNGDSRDVPLSARAVAEGRYEQELW